MRKSFLLMLFLSIACHLQGQSKLGLKFSPSISTNRISLLDSLYNAANTGGAFKFSLGLIFDYEITETYYLSTGLIFVPKHLGIEITEEPDQPSANAPNPSIQEYRLNYLQLPVTLKLFTNEVQPDTKVFFQVGLAPEVKVFSEPRKEEYNLIEAFKLFDGTIIFGAGAEYRAGLNTTLFGGFTYQRGLANSIKTVNFDFQQDEELFIRNSFISLDLGIKF